jgi:hypothetical protein
MSSVVILAVVAVWAAVIVPPLLRSRVENRPNASVTDFRRQLSTLQRAVPTRTMVPMRGMARPLAQAPQQRAAGYGHTTGQMRRTQAGPAPVQRERMQEGSLRRSHGNDDTSGTRSHRTLHVHKVSQREIVRRRRSNIVFMLVTTVAISGFLAATTHSSGLVYLFALSFVSLCGYCYKLVQIRNFETDRSYGDQAWFHAA